MRRGDGGTQELKKTLLTAGEGGWGALKEQGKQRDACTPITLRLTQAHHPPTEISLSLLSLSDQAHHHPVPTQNP